MGDVTRRDVNLLLDEVVDGGAPVVANRLLAAVRKMFNWAASKDYVAANPCAGIMPPSAEDSRDRVLGDDELRRVWEAASALGELFGPLVRLLILTGQRRDEVAGMRWSELDLDAGLWTIPKERAKNGKAHAVPLSVAAVAVLAVLPRLEMDDGTPSDFVFTTTGTTPVSGFSKAKERLDLLAGVEGWRFHDIRRTVTTGLARMGIAPQVADRILNHVQGTIRGVAAVYNRHDYLDESRAALDAWAQRLDRIVNGTPANVVDLRHAVA
ncbi:integrase [Azospirillum fermentarium]|nr:integrase [Azospirillum fermentarium]